MWPDTTWSPRRGPDTPSSRLSLGPHTDCCPGTGLKQQQTCNLTCPNVSSLTYVHVFMVFPQQNTILLKEFHFNLNKLCKTGCVVPKTFEDLFNTYVSITTLTSMWPITTKRKFVIVYCNMFDNAYMLLSMMFTAKFVKLLTLISNPNITQLKSISEMHNIYCLRYVYGTLQMSCIVFTFYLIGLVVY